MFWTLESRSHLDLLDRHPTLNPMTPQGKILTRVASLKPRPDLRERALMNIRQTRGLLRRGPWIRTITVGLVSTMRLFPTPGVDVIKLFFLWLIKKIRLRANVIKLFYFRKLRIFVISLSICLWQAFPASLMFVGKARSLPEWTPFRCPL
jgi:hypothetical protein